MSHASPLRTSPPSLAARSAAAAATQAVSAHAAALGTSLLPRLQRNSPAGRLRLEHAATAAAPGSADAVLRRLFARLPLPLQGVVRALLHDRMAILARVHAETERLALGVHRSEESGEVFLSLRAAADTNARELRRRLGGAAAAEVMRALRAPEVLVAMASPLEAKPAAAAGRSSTVVFGVRGTDRVRKDNLSYAQLAQAKLTRYREEQGEEAFASSGDAGASWAGGEAGEEGAEGYEDAAGWGGLEEPSGGDLGGSRGDLEEPGEPSAWPNELHAPASPSSSPDAALRRLLHLLSLSRTGAPEAPAPEAALPASPQRDFDGVVAAQLADLMRSART